MRANEIMENELSSRDTVRLERAIKSFEDGFETKTAKDQAMADLNGVYEGLREQALQKIRPLFWAAQDTETFQARAGMEGQYETTSKMMNDIPFGLHQIRERHYPIFEKYGNLPLLKKLVALRAEMKDAPLVPKKRDLEKAAIKAAGDESVIGKATQPLKEVAMEETKKKANAFIAEIKKELEDNNYDLDAIVPPLPELPRGTSVWSQEYNRYQEKKKARDARRNVYLGFLKRVGDGTFEWVDALAERYVQACLDATAMHFDSYVAKMNQKIDNPVSAEFAWVRGVWGDSRLRVVLQDGTTEVWQTKVIVNVSKLGKLFNQWPTRRLK